MKIARREFSTSGGGRGRLAHRKGVAYPLQPMCIPLLDPTIRRSFNALLRVGKMQKLSSFLFTTLISMSIVALGGESRAQNSGGTLPPKTGTRLITLGTRGGPIPVGGRAQYSKQFGVPKTIHLV